MCRPALVRLAVACGLVVTAAGSPDLRAQDSLPPWAGGFTASLGQPGRTRLYTGGTFGLDWRSDYTAAPVSYVKLGVVRDLGNPVLGLVAASVEAYGGLRSDEADGGLRALLHVPILRSSLGVDYNFRDELVGIMVGIDMPVRRGGVFRGGTLLRWEWTSPPLSGFRGSVLVPLRRPTAGKTRPLETRVDVSVHSDRPEPAPGRFPALDSVVRRIRLAVAHLQRLVVPPIDRPGPDPHAALASLLAELRDRPALDGAAGPGLDVDGLVRGYHQALDRAFSIAAGGGDLPPGATTPEGRAMADSARRVLREQLLYPYDRLLGQRKTKTTLAGLATHARGNFARSVVAGTALPVGQEAALHFVFEQLLDAILDLERAALRDWGDSRLVWLPLQLALRPSEHDSQAELDAIVEAVVGVRFTDGNQVGYVINGEFQQELVRTILRAEEYHVLWIHDFRGQDGTGIPDTVSYHLVLDAYYQALIGRIREYDTRARIPTYMIFVDQHYYERNHGRYWLDLLEDPLGRIPRLPAHLSALASALRQRQAELRTAIDESRLLQAETRQYSREWLRNLVKVHVSVTNPADQSFWSRQVIPLIGLPDNIMRDHRKIAFYDITEEDPSRGLAIYTGMGIGEHYVGQSWEDRSIMVQGPAVLSLKAQARSLLESQGLTGDRIPYALRPRQAGPGRREADSLAAGRARDNGSRDQRAVELHNGTGFHDKQVSVAKAVLYGLMPAGAVILAPDPLWGNSVYAALLAGSAFRGCRVLLMAPSLEAAPASNWPSMAVAHEIFARLIVLQQELGRELEEAGGGLKTGLYNPDVGVDAALDRLELAYANARRTPFLRRLLPVHEQVDSMIVGLMRQRGAAPRTGFDRVRARGAPRVRPRLHLKATFLASREGWDSLLARPEMGTLFRTYLAPFLDPGGNPRAQAEDLSARSEALDSTFRASRPPAERERILYFLLIGSANQDYRSMLLDGEASMLLSDWSGIVALIDFILITSLSVWIDDLETLDALLPAPSGFRRGIARWIRYIL